jgi:O-antigen/teichoic acid export membrane protein
MPVDDVRARRSPVTLLGGLITRHTMIYALGTLAVGPFSIVSVVFLTRLMAPSQYGDLAILLVFAGFLTTFYNVGTLHGTFLWVYGVSEGGEGDDVEVDAKTTAAPRRALGTGVAITLIVLVAGTALCFLLAPALTHLGLDTPGGAASIRWAAVSGATGSLWRLTVNVFRMERRPISFAALSCLRPLFVVGGAVPFVAIGLGVNGALAGTALGTIIATLVCMFAARRSYALAFSWRDARQILLRGGKVVIPVLCLYIVHSADINLLSIYAPGQELGVYRVASRFAAVPSYFASAFLMAWSPLQRGVLFQATYNQLGEERTKTSLLTYYLVIAMTIVLLLDVGADGLVLLAGPAYRAAAPLIPALGISFVVYGLFIVLMRTVRSKRTMTWYTICAAIAAALDVGLCALTIPWLGAYGPPVAEVVGLGTACVMLTFFVTRLEHVSFSFERRRLAGLLAAVLVAGTVQVAGDALWPDGRAFVLTLVVLSYVGVMALTGVVPRAHIRPLIALAKAALRERISAEDPLRDLSELPASRRELLTSLGRGGLSVSTLADRTGAGADTVMAEFAAAVGELTHSRPLEAGLDARVGAYLLSEEPEAQRDTMARELVEGGADAMDLLHMNEAAQQLRAKPRTRGALVRMRPSVSPLRQRSIAQSTIDELTDALESLPEATRRAAIAVLRDGQTPAQAGTQTGLAEPIVAARVVRILRRVGHLERGGPHDVAIGLALFGRQGDAHHADAHAIGALHDAIRGTSRRSWRRIDARGARAANRAHAQTSVALRKSWRFGAEEPFRVPHLSMATAQPTAPAPASHRRTASLVEVA